jgi:hypothetical protein
MEGSSMISKTEGELAASLTLFILLSSFLGSTAQLRPWPPPQNPGAFLGVFLTIFFFTG